MSNGKVAIIAGVGPGLSASIARAFLREGYKIGGMARREENLKALESELGAENFKGVKTDLTSAEEVKGAVSDIEAALGNTNVYVHNATTLLAKPFLEITPDEFETTWRSAVMTAVNGGHAVLPGMVERGEGAFLVTGATASMRGGPNFSAFASAKFGLRGLSQSLARAMGPEGVHVAHVVIDGVIWGASAERYGMTQDKCLEPDDIAQVYVDLARQPKSCWTHEIDVRPFSENF